MLIFRQVTIFILVSLSSCHVCFAVSIIKNGTKNIVLTESPYYLYEDTIGHTTIQDLISKPILFKKSSIILPENDHRGSVYWVKFPIIDSSDYYAKWFIELYNYRIDSLEIFVVNKGKIIHHKISGDHHPFAEKEIPHKNFAYVLPQIKNDTIYYYFKIKSELKVDFYTVIKSVDYFVEYSNGEYYFLGMLYGILGIMLLYNLFHFLIVREMLYLYYLFSIVALMLYFMSKDGTGFQYIWNNYPQFNDRIPSITIFFAILNQLFFTYNLFYKEVFTKRLSDILIGIVVLRSFYFFIILLFFPTSDQVMLADLPALIFILWVGLLNVKTKEYGTYYFPLGSFVFLLGFFVTAIFEVNILPHSTFVVYASAFGLVGQIVLYGAFLSYRHRIIITNKKLAEQMLSIQNLEISQYEAHQKELLDVVNKATESLTIKNSKIKRINQDLESFVYKSSHNLRGPIRSILGICNLADSINDKENFKELFTHVKKSASELDKELLYITNITDIKNYQFKIEKVNLYSIFKKHFEEYDIALLPNDLNEFYTQGDKWLLEEGARDIRTIFDKLSSRNPSLPEIKIFKEQEVFIMSLTFEGKLMETKHIDTFFEPYNKDVSFLYDLYSEPYLSRLIMDKIKGSITISIIEKEILNITVRSKN